MLETEDHPAAVDVQHCAAGWLARRTPVPPGGQRCAVAGGEADILGVDTVGRRGVGGNLVHHAVATSSPRLDVADGRFLRLSERFHQRGQLYVHLKVETQRHDPTVSWRYVTSAAVETTTDRPVAPFAVRTVSSLAVFVAVLHCAAATFAHGYWFDEVYMLAIGHYHREWGSADQPPVAPALAALMHAFAPGSQVALALPAALATGCAVLLAGLIVRELGCVAVQLVLLAGVLGVALGGYGLWRLFRSADVRQ